MSIKTINIIGSRMDLGALRKGVDLGPSAIRNAGLPDKIQELGIGLKDLGDVIPEAAEKSENPKLHYAREINIANEQLFEKVRGTHRDGVFPLVLGGDHSIAAGSASATAEAFGKIGIIWMDAHADFNDERITPSGNLHGMPLSAVCGLGPDCMVAYTEARVKPENVAIVGARDIDPEESIKLETAGVSVFTMEDVRRLGINEVMHRAVSISSAGCQGIHLSFDMDAIEPSEAPGVGIPVKGGLSTEETIRALEIIREEANLLSMDLVELNPILDIENRTAILAANLIMTVLGPKRP